MHGRDGGRPLTLSGPHERTAASGASLEERIDATCSRTCSKHIKPTKKGSCTQGRDIPIVRDDGRPLALPALREAIVQSRAPIEERIDDALEEFLIGHFGRVHRREHALRLAGLPEEEVQAQVYKACAAVGVCLS
jgi:hypothetical protein